MQLQWEVWLDGALEVRSDGKGECGKGPMHDEVVKNPADPRRASGDQAIREHDLTVDGLHPGRLRQFVCLQVPIGPYDEWCPNSVEEASKREEPIAIGVLKSHGVDQIERDQNKLDALESDANWHPIMIAWCGDGFEGGIKEE
eukprot:3584138-Alexandrium_andersonii.AAC.1